ncbi:MAG: glycosyltransferase [Parcubacteria group bacterium Gr01-1014_70]|nr:MAG: glycosyltransferase [Parcubacteria group bacterium Gr01-1014_70]
MRLVYLTTFTYPSSYANRLQVLKMAEAFSRLCDFLLVIGNISGNVSDVFEQNSIRSAFSVESCNTTLRGRFRMVRAVRAWRRIVRKNPPGTVFYAREPLPAFMLTFLSKRFRSNFFFEAHSFTRYPAFIYRRVFGCVRGVIATSEKKAYVFQERFRVPKQKILVRGNGFDGEFFRVMPTKEEARNALHLPQDKRVVTMIGKPTAERDIATFLMATEKMPEALFLSVGGLPQEIEHLRSHAGFARVRFVERVRPADVAAYYAASDAIAVLLSTAFPEIAEFASPLKAREALATGVPVLFSDVPALRDVADDSFVTYVKPDDADALAAGIQSQFADYDSAVKKAAMAREIFMKQSWQNRAEDIVDFMENQERNKSRHCFSIMQG